MSNPRIAGSLAVPVVLDATGFDTALRNTIRGVVESTPQIKEAFRNACDGLEQKFASTFNSVDTYWSRVLTKMENRLAKGNFSPATVNTIQSINSMATAVDNVELKLRSLAALHFAEKMHLPQVKADFADINQQVIALNASLTQMQGNTRLFALSSGIAGQGAMAASAAAYNAAYSAYGVQQQQIAQSSASGPAGLGRPIAAVNPWVSATLGTQLANTTAAQAFKTRLAAAANRNMNPYGPTAARVGPSPASLAAAADARRLERMTRLLDDTDPDAYRGALHNPPSASRRDDYRSTIYERNRDGKRLSPEHAGRFRFIAQNVGFGVDDAIQSYQYGGMRASIRAASNNMTAVAATAIPSPIIAAVAVVALSAISAALPSLLDRLGLDRNTRDMDSKSREDFRNRDSGGYYAQREQDWFLDRTSSRSELVGNAAAYAASLRFSSATGAYDGSDISQLMMQKSEKMDKYTRLGRDKSAVNSAREDRYNANMASGTWYGSMTGDYGDKFTVELGKELDRLEEEMRKLSDADMADQAKISTALERLAANRKIMSVVGKNTAYTQQDFDRGDLSFLEYEDRLHSDADYHVGRIKKQKLPRAEEEAAIFEVRNRVENNLNSPLLRDRIAANRFTASEANSRFDWQHSGPHSGLGNFFESRNAELRELQFSVNNRGPLNKDEASRRLATARIQNEKDQKRVIEDDLDELNPERNAATRLHRHLERQTETLENEASLSPEIHRNRMMASLRGLDAARERALQPSGTRQFVSSGYKIHSTEDRNLEGRMLGQYVSRGGKKYDDSMTLVQIRDALRDLAAQLQLDAQELNR